MTMARASNCNWHTSLVFSFTQPTADAIKQQLAAAFQLPASLSCFLTLQLGLKTPRLPSGFAHDYSRSCIGHGERTFHRARRAFEEWAPFDLGWVAVANPSAPISTGQVVAVEAHTLGLWSLSLSRIVQVLDAPTSFGFLYSTTPLHVEEGEERFLLTFDPESGDVWYDLEAVSRPRHPLARFGFPITRSFQHKFARESHRRMKEAVSSRLV
jgi:uncharacterized protein (UPF0548 family)